jgi:hypothetical protein
VRTAVVGCWRTHLLQPPRTQRALPAVVGDHLEFLRVPVLTTSQRRGLRPRPGLGTVAQPEPATRVSAVHTGTRHPAPEAGNQHSPRRENSDEHVPARISRPNRPSSHPIIPTRARSPTTRLPAHCGGAGCGCAAVKWGRCRVVRPFSDLTQARPRNEAVRSAAVCSHEDNSKYGGLCSWVSPTMASSVLHHGVTG